MLVGGLIAGLIAIGVYWTGAASPSQSLLGGVLLFAIFAYNMARAEVEELKLILDDESPGCRERNASWTSTWDWNRLLKRNRSRKF